MVDVVWNDACITLAGSFGASHVRKVHTCIFTLQVHHTCRFISDDTRPINVAARTVLLTADRSIWWRVHKVCVGL